MLQRSNRLDDFVNEISFATDQSRIENYISCPAGRSGDGQQPIAYDCGERFDLQLFTISNLRRVDVPVPCCLLQ
jgi:hypothetical protein